MRIAATPEGSLAVGRTLPGRGAWLCRGSSECLDLAERRGGFARSLRRSVAPEAVSALRRSLADGSDA